MKENGITHVTEEDCRNIVRFYDVDGDGWLNYTEFLAILIPAEDPYLRAVLT